IQADLAPLPGNAASEPPLTPPPRIEDLPDDDPKEAASPDAGRHALLVGASYYPSMPARDQLPGCANDVLLFRRLLVEHFAFPRANVVILSEREGARRGPDRRPPRANIERELRRLAEKVKPGNQVVLLLSGHGAQQPEGENPADPEPDGLDELYIPRDVGR